MQPGPNTLVGTVETDIAPARLDPARMMTIGLILGLWFIASVPLGMLVGRCLAGRAHLPAEPPAAAQPTARPAAELTSLRRG
jgi:hypothetical protein